MAELEGYSVSREPGPTTMRVEASLIDLRGPAGAGSALNSMRRDVRELATAGSLVFLMEMKDSKTGQILARAADSARAPALGRSPDAETDWQAVDEAAALGADLCQIWKDVDGFFTADPRIVSNARCLEEVSYEEAMELTYYGANVISAKALMPLAAKGIPCQVRNTYDAAKPGTLVHAQAKLEGSVRGISHLHDVSAITLQGGFLRGRVGVAQRVMGALASVSVSTLLIVHSSSEYSLTLCVRQADAQKARRALQEEFHFELLHHLLEDIVALDDRAVISLVGQGMKHARGIAARFLTAISTAGVNVEASCTFPSTSGRVVRIVVGDEDAPAGKAALLEAEQLLHQVGIPDPARRACAPLSRSPPAAGRCRLGESREH